MHEEKPKKYIEKLKKKIFLKEGANINQKDGKRKIENLIVFILILIITVILINSIWNDDKNKEGNIISLDKTLAKTETEEINHNNQTTYKSNLEEKLEDILQNIEGVGKVKVLLTYSESSQTVAMYNEDTTQNDTQETDTSRRKQKDKPKLK